MLFLTIIAQVEPVSAWQLAWNAGLMVKFVLLVLVLLSVVCWGTIIFKFIQLHLAKKESRLFVKAFWAGENLEKVAVSTKRFHYSPLAQMFKMGMNELDLIRQGRKSDEDSSLINLSRGELGIENIERALNRSSANEAGRLTRFLSFLATTGSAAPFIGLFGTVWGIMTSFQGIGGAPGGASFEMVGRGISEALIATAAGLAAAIPAVVAYNYFLSVIRAIQMEMDNFHSEFMNIVERHYRKKTAGSPKKKQ